MYGNAHILSSFCALLLVPGVAQGSASPSSDPGGLQPTGEAVSDDFWDDPEPAPPRATRLGVDLTFFNVAFHIERYREEPRLVRFGGLRLGLGGAFRSTTKDTETHDPYDDEWDYDSYTSSSLVFMICGVATLHVGRGPWFAEASLGPALGAKWLYIDMVMGGVAGLAANYRASQHATVHLGLMTGRPLRTYDTRDRYYTGGPTYLYSYEHNWTVFPDLGVTLLW